MIEILNQIPRLNNHQLAIPLKQKCPKVVGDSSRALKRQKRKDPPTTPTIDLNPPYSSVRFISPTTKQNYTEGYAKRPVLCERGIVLEQFEESPCALLPLIFAKGWQSWVNFQHKAIIPLVKEFYVNVTKSRVSMPCMEIA